MRSEEGWEWGKGVVGDRAFSEGEKEGANCSPCR